MPLTQAQRDALVGESLLVATAAQRLATQAATLAQDTTALVADPIIVPPPPPPPPAQALVPVVSIQMIHHQFGPLVDYIPAAAAQPTEIPWDDRLLGDPVNRILAPFDRATATYPVKRPMFVHPWGLPTELYDEIPDWLPDGRPEPLNSEYSDHIATIADTLRARPPRTGKRGIGQPTPYAVWAPHPHHKADGTLIPAQFRPMWNGVTHAGEWVALFVDRYASFGQIPGCRYVYDYVGNDADRTTFFLALPGDAWNGQTWSNPRFVKVDRKPGKLDIATGTPEDATKFTVATLMSGLASATGITCDEAGNWFGVDHLASKVYRNGLLLCAVPGAFAVRYDRDPNAPTGASGQLYVVSNDWGVRIVDAVTGVVGPQLTPAAPVGSFRDPKSYGADFFAVSIDRGETWYPRVNGKPVFSISRVHTGGNINVMEFYPQADGTYTTKYDRQIWSDGQTWQQLGDCKLVHEPDHYDWGARDFHWYERARMMNGYGNTLLALAIAGELLPNAAPALTSTGAIPVELADWTLTYLGKCVIAGCAPQFAPGAPVPSLTCLMSLGGWPASDTVANGTFDGVEAWIRRGCGGSFPRPDLTPVHILAVMTVLFQNSQRYLIEGVALIRGLRTWWSGKYGPLPAAPVLGAWSAVPLQFGSVDKPVWMEVRELPTPGHVQVCGFNNGASQRTRYNLLAQTIPIVRPAAGATLIVNPRHPDPTQTKTATIINPADVDLTSLGLHGLHAIIVDTGGAYPTRPCVVRLP